VVWEDGGGDSASYPIPHMCAIAGWFSSKAEILIGWNKLIYPISPVSSSLSQSKSIGFVT